MLFARDEIFNYVFADGNGLNDRHQQYCVI